MFGRGLITNPALIGQIQIGKAPDKQTLRQFHDEILEEYQAVLSGDKNVLFRMKELWNFMAPAFTNHEKYSKKIRKALTIAKYQEAVQSLFAEQDLVF